MANLLLLSLQPVRLLAADIQSSLFLTSYQFFPDSIRFLSYSWSDYWCCWKGISVISHLEILSSLKITPLPFQQRSGSKFLTILYIIESLWLLRLSFKVVHAVSVRRLSLWVPFSAPVIQPWSLRTEDCQEDRCQHRNSRPTKYPHILSTIALLMYYLKYEDAMSHDKL
jgi:hypothetical protein